MLYYVTLSALVGVCATAPSTVLLQNAADAGTVYPMMGLGTAGGSHDNGFAAYPECWASCLDGQCLSPMPDGGCGKYTEAAVATFFSCELANGGLCGGKGLFQRDNEAPGADPHLHVLPCTVGGRRLDSANSVGLRCTTAAFRPASTTYHFTHKLDPDISAFAL